MHTSLPLLEWDLLKTQPARMVLAPVLLMYANSHQHQRHPRLSSPCSLPVPPAHRSRLLLWRQYFLQPSCLVVAFRWQ